MTTLTNSFHNTSITIKANSGDRVSRTTFRRVRRILCGISDCTCGHADGTRDSRFRLESQGFESDAPILVIDTETYAIQR